jgi:hypothetical protein
LRGLSIVRVLVVGCHVALHALRKRTVLLSAARMRFCHTCEDIGRGARLGTEKRGKI